MAPYSYFILNHLFSLFLLMVTWQEENWPEGKRRRHQEKILAIFWLREQRSWKENSLDQWLMRTNIGGTWFWWAFVMHSSPLIPQIKSPLSSWWKRWGLISQRRWGPKGPLMHCLHFPWNFLLNCEKDEWFNLYWQLILKLGFWRQNQNLQPLNVFALLH